MLKLPKGLKKKKKKSKKDQELFTEEELEQYKRELKAKQEAAAAKSDVGESDAASDAEGCSSSIAGGAAAPAASHSVTTAVADTANGAAADSGAHAKSAEDEEWAKFKALTSGVDSILHKTQDELDRIKKESFYQRLPSAAEKKRLEEEEAAQREAERLEEEKRKAAEFESQRDKLAEAVVELSESEEEVEDEGDIFATDYIDAITSGEIQLGVVPDSPVFELDLGPDPFDTAYAEKVIVGADKAKGNKKLVSLGAAVEVLSGRVDREHALALAQPKRKLRKGIQNLLLSESVDQGDSEAEFVTVEPQRNLLDELVDDVPVPDAPIDLSVSLHLHLIQPKKPSEEDDEAEANPDLSEFDVLKDDEDDEFAELAAESLTKKEEITVIKEIPLPLPEVLNEIVEADWAEFEQLPEESAQKAKPARPPPPARPASGPHIVPGAIYISDDDEDANQDDDPFNTSYAEQVIKKTTVLEEDDDFDPRAEEKSTTHPARPPPPAANLLSQPTRDLLGGSNTDISKIGAAPIAPVTESIEPEDFDPFDTSAVSAIVQPKATELKFIERELLPESSRKLSLSDDDFDPRAEEPAAVAAPAAIVKNDSLDFDINRRKSSLSLNLASKTVGFLVPNQDLLGAANEGSSKKPLTPYYAPAGKSIAEKESEDPFDTSYVPETKPSEVELKHLEKDLLTKSTLSHSLSDPDFDPRAPPTPVPAEDLLSVKDNINIKVLTPAQESKDIVDPEELEYTDPFDTSIAANLQPGKAELKLIENELLPAKTPEITTGVLDTQTDAQELGLGDKVLTPSVPVKQLTLPEEIDPFDTSIAENLAPGETEIKLLESELIER